MARPTEEIIEPHLGSHAAVGSIDGLSVSDESRGLGLEGPGRQCSTAVDPTPFKTRSKLLTVYANQTRSILSGGDPFPVAVEVNISNFCIQNCGWCISANVRDDGRGHFLDIDAPGFQKFLSDFKRLGGRCVGWSGGGEPTTHPKFAEALYLVKEAGLTQGLITHGAFRPSLIEPIAETCAWIRISIDTNDRTIYARRRRTKPEQYDQVLNNAEALVERSANVGLNMNVTDWNREHIESLYELACDIHVNYLQVRPTLDTPFPHGDPLDRLSRESVPAILSRLNAIKDLEHHTTKLIVSYDKFEDILKPKGGRTYGGCHSHRIFVVLNWDGNLKVCMYHLADSRFTLGNIFRSSLQDIWASEKRGEVLLFCESGLNHELHGCQICCKGHEINKVLCGQVSFEAASNGERSPFI